MNIEVRQVSWQNAHEEIKRIRFTVFVEEQQVPIEEEIDGADELTSTLHFLATIDGQAVATGRILASGKIGRIAVLQDYRGQGVGSKVTMRFCADHTTHASLQLNSQTQAMRFYRQLGFVEQGPEFDDAGIPHKLMTAQLNTRAQLTSLYQDEVIRIERACRFTHHLIRMISAGRRSVTILSNHLDQDVFNEELSEAISSFARQSSQAQVRILVQDSRRLHKSPHPLVRLVRRLPSSIHILRTTEPPQKPETAYVIIDKQHIVYFNEEQEHIGFANYRAPAEADHQLDEFERLWQHHSEADPNLRVLNL